MSGHAPSSDVVRRSPETGSDAPASGDGAADELIMHLERDQFVAETSRPVPRAVLSRRTIAGLWVLRVFVVLVSLMVIYTFVEQLR